MLESSSVCSALHYSYIMHSPGRTILVVQQLNCITYVVLKLRQN